jgi:hypothetical protein
MAAAGSLLREVQLRFRAAELARLLVVDLRCLRVVVEPPEPDLGAVVEDADAPLLVGLVPAHADVLRHLLRRARTAAARALALGLLGLLGLLLLLLLLLLGLLLLLLLLLLLRLRLLLGRSRSLDIGVVLDEQVERGDVALLPAEFLLELGVGELVEELRGLVALVDQGARVLGGARGDADSRSR